MPRLLEKAPTISSLTYHGKEIHLVGVLHGTPITSTRLMFGTSMAGKRKIGNFLQEKGIRGDNAVFLLEPGTLTYEYTPSKEDIAVWETLIGAKIEAVKILREPSSLVDYYKRKKSGRLGRVFKRHPGKAALFAFLVSFLATPFIVLSPTLVSKRLWEAWQDPLRSVVEYINYKMVTKYPKLTKDGLYRDFVSAEIIRTLAIATPKRIKHIVVLTGLGHVPLTERFIRDWRFRRRYKNKLRASLGKERYKRLRASYAKSFWGELKNKKILRRRPKA